MLLKRQRKDNTVGDFLKTEQGWSSTRDRGGRWPEKVRSGTL